MELTYRKYLKIDELLSLQNPLSDGPEHDETLFIIIHQVYELWFKQILHELRRLAQLFENGETAKSLHTLNRILAIWRTMVKQIDVLETMTPLSFGSFRSRLESASGFQSYQFRLLEITLGHRNQALIDRSPFIDETRRILDAAMTEPSTYDYFLRFIAAKGYPLESDILDRDLSQPNLEDERVRKNLVKIYREDPVLTQVCERLVDLDEGLQEWRYRHVKMVQRTIGTKMGTGGSSGAEYLAKTLFKPLFPDLWSIRVEF